MFWRTVLVDCTQLDYTVGHLHQCFYCMFCEQDCHADIYDVHMHMT